MTAPDLDVFRNDSVNDAVATDSGPAVDLGGPSVTVTVPEGGLVEIYARADMQSTGGGMNGEAQVQLYEPGFLPDAPVILSAPTGAGLVSRYSAPSEGSTGVAQPTRGGMITLAPPSGTYTFSLQYSARGGSTATFQNRAIWAGVIN